jgi:hypothetical protein
MEMKKKCIELSTDSKIKCEENKRKIIFDNRKREIVEKIIVDGCQITEGVRCDFLVRHKKREFFVELKGEDIQHAFDQLKNSINLLGSGDCKERNCYVISSRSPLVSAEIQNIKLQFIRKFNSQLIVKNNNFEVIL